ncbi:hypothetical protein VTO58DRAFT_107914 [Aureobasidium pullulans]
MKQQDSHLFYMASTGSASTITSEPASIYTRPHPGSEFKSTKTRDIQTTQAVYVFVPPLSTTRSSGPPQAAALSYIAKTL